MNDRFKFRVYIKYAKMMCYDVNSFYIDRIKNKITIHFDNHTKTFKFDDVVLEQCTGLKDKNGKLIYEGDWLKTKDGYYCYVVWFEGFWWVESLPSEAMDFEHSEFYGECEVVGNIHENPELLEKD